MAEKATFAIKKSDLIDLSDGKFAVRFPKNSATVLSIQPNGDHEVRPDTAIGAWESAKLVGDCLVYEHENNLWLVIVKDV